jgi:hypothetical protein
MTMLRIKLEHARTVYVATRYPGDLAGELIPAHLRGSSNRWWWVGGAGGSALAAALVVSWSVNVRNPHPIGAPTAGRLVPVATFSTFPGLNGTPMNPGDSRYRLAGDEELHDFAPRWSPLASQQQAARRSEQPLSISPGPSFDNPSENSNPNYTPFGR